MINESIKYLNDNEIKKPLVKIPDYLNSLDEKQKIAASVIDGNYLVIAGPGSGKTHTMIYRIMHMVKTGVDPKDICMITFTRKAAREMEYRLDQLLPGIEIGFIGTFHALAHFVESKRYTASRARFRIIDTSDDVEVLKLVKEDNNIKFNNKVKMSTIQKVISYSYNTLLPIDKSLILMGKEDLNSDIDNITLLESLYYKYKSVNNIKTYDDLLKDFFGGNSESFPYLIVDEYQDTNNLQIRFIKQLNVKNLMVIGDDMQGIYSFRGANHKIILNFANDFENPKLIKLDNNYRSTKNIVSCVDIVANTSDYKFDKQLKTINKHGDKVQILNTANKDLSKIILPYINKYQDESIAFIYRTNQEKKFLEPELIKQGIPYTIYGGMKLLERRHIKDVLSILLTNLSKSDEINFMRALKICSGVGEITALKMVHAYPDITSIKSNDQIKFIQEIIDNPDLLLNDLLDKVITWYLTLDDVLMKSYYIKEDIISDLELLKLLAYDYYDKINFINDLILDPVIDYTSKKEEQKIVLTSIHSCKGLEFDTVFHVHQTNPFMSYNKEEKQEAQRLFYVAISRAKHKLFILDQNEHSRDLYQILSDFKVDNNINTTTYKYVSDNKSPLNIKVNNKKEKQSLFKRIKNKLKG